MESVCCLSELSTSGALSFLILTAALSHPPGSFLLFPLYKWRDWGLENFNNLPNIPQLVSGEHGMQTIFGSRALITTL